MAATLADILRRHKKMNRDFSEMPDFVAIQLNDTHPAIAIPELMRLLMDEEGLVWDDAWPICEKTFAYTNHTVLPEALETWPVELIRRILPRHMEIIFEINRRFLALVGTGNKADKDLVQRVSLIVEGGQQRVRMAHLAIVGSHTVNGVAELHSKNHQRRTVQGLRHGISRSPDQCHQRHHPPPLAGPGQPAAGAIDRRHHRPHVGSPTWTGCGTWNPWPTMPNFAGAGSKPSGTTKKRLARYILRKIGVGVDPDTLFSVQVKRIHEYKRQLLNVLHVITLYHRILVNPDASVVPRTVIFCRQGRPGLSSG